VSGYLASGEERKNESNERLRFEGFATVDELDAALMKVLAQT
jgi:hypothetical protein